MENTVAQPYVGPSQEDKDKTYERYCSMYRNTKDHPDGVYHFIRLVSDLAAIDAASLREVVRLFYELKSVAENSLIKRA